MTLIAATAIAGWPFYFGDLLISRPALPLEPDERVDIPASDDINAVLPREASHRISGMRQKLNILGNNLIVAWAGSLVQARAALRELGEMARRTNFDVIDAYHHLLSLPPAENKELSLIGTVLRQQADDPDLLAPDVFSQGATVVENQNGKCFVAGTGSADFLDVWQRQLATSPPPQNGAERGIWAWVMGTALAGRFIGHEMTFGSNLLRWWGGGIEVAHYNKGQFIKMTNTLHVFCEGLIDGDEVSLSFIPIFIKYDYFEDVLIIQKFACEIRGTRWKILSHHYRAYLPLLKDRYDYDWRKCPQFDLNYQTLCCYTFVRDALGNRRILTRVDVGWQPFSIRPCSSKGQIEMSFQDNWMHELMDWVQQSKHPTFQWRPQASGA